MYFFTADEHYNHAAIIGYCNRPFDSVDEMLERLIENHNRVVAKQDITVHCGDFGFFRRQGQAEAILSRLNGSHILLKGSHDGYLPSSAKHMWRRMVQGQYIVACHYALRTWDQAKNGAWNLYGHSHGTLLPLGKQWDVGVDNNDYTPVSFDRLQGIMESRPQIHTGGHDRIDSLDGYQGDY